MTTDATNIFLVIFGIILVLLSASGPDSRINHHFPNVKLLVIASGLVLIMGGMVREPKPLSPPPSQWEHGYPKAALKAAKSSTTSSRPSRTELPWTACINQVNGAISSCVVPRESAIYYPLPARLQRAEDGGHDGGAEADSEGDGA